MSLRFKETLAPLGAGVSRVWAERLAEHCALVRENIDLAAQVEYAQSPGMRIVLATTCANLDPDVAARIVDLCLELDDELSWATLRLLVEAPGLQANLLERLYATGDQQLQMLLASCPGIPLTVQEDLARGYVGIRERLAGNRSLDSSLQFRFAGDAELSVRVSLALSSSLTLEVALRLLADPNPRVRDIVREGRWVKEVTGQVPAVCVSHRLEEVAEFVLQEGGDVEAASALLPNWEGSLDELVEASLLV